ncbi:type VI secretion system needle protein Hcp, partial [Tenacibaculum finnmarkense genomovar ulcerans]
MLKEIFIYGCFFVVSLGCAQNKKGKIASNVYGGRINITIESTADTSVIEAMLNSQFKAIEGKV